MNNRVLVAYASKNGSTAQIAEVIAGELRSAGVEADCIDAADVRSVAPYSTVVLGSAVYMKHWRRPARSLLRHAARDLAERALWIFSSGPVGEPDPQKEDPSWLEPARVIEQAERLGAVEHVVFGGRVPLVPHNFVERAMLENTPEQFRDRRDWDEIRAWARKIAAHAREREAAGAA